MASVSPPAGSTQPALPTGPAVFKTVPYAFILPEIVSMLNSLPTAPNNGSSSRAGFDPCRSLVLQDSLYHGATAILYMSAAVLQANATIISEPGYNSVLNSLLHYQLNCAATFFAFLTTFLYILHAFSIYYQ
ncbi:MALL protein, partial [Columbina picui]|nr:MALL protein [Columbina picui]